MRTPWTDLPQLQELLPDRLSRFEAACLALRALIEPRSVSAIDPRALDSLKKAVKLVASGDGSAPPLIRRILDADARMAWLKEFGNLRSSRTFGGEVVEYLGEAYTRHRRSFENDTLANLPRAFLSELENATGCTLKTVRTARFELRAGVNVDDLDTSTRNEIREKGAWAAVKWEQFPPFLLDDRFKLRWPDFGMARKWFGAACERLRAAKRMDLSPTDTEIEKALINQVARFDLPSLRQTSSKAILARVNSRDLVLPWELESEQLQQETVEFFRQTIERERIRHVLDRCVLGGRIRRISKVTGCPYLLQFVAVLKPQWDRNRRELRLGQHLCKAFSHHRSPDQVAILEKFQQEDWPASIASPFEPAIDRFARQPDMTKLQKKLRNAVRKLNSSKRIQFRLDGTGNGIVHDILS